MAAQICCVDHERPGVKTIAGRWFCEDHYRKATYARPHFVRSELINVVGVLVFVGVVVALDAGLKPILTGGALVAAGVLLALVPAVLWLLFFYQQDRLEPEPVGNVARMFVIGLALASAAGIPLTNQFFAVDDWLYRDNNGLVTAMAAFFIIGAVEAFVIFSTVRYFIFDSPEFDERTDGVIYGTAAGLGYATALNLQFILSNGGAALGPGEVYVAEVALAHAAIGGLLGYFLGKARLEQEPIWWLPGGLLLATLLNGFFLILRGELDRGSITDAGTLYLPSPWGLVLAGGLAVSVTLVVTWLIRRDIARTLANPGSTVTTDPTIGDRRASLATVAMFVVLLLLGTGGWYMANYSVRAVDAAGYQANIPAYYSVTTGEAEAFRATDYNTGNEFLIQMPALVGNVELQDAITLLTADRTDRFEIYKVMASGETTVQGRPARFQRFAYVEPGGLTGAAPTVVQGLDYIFLDRSQVVVITLISSPEEIGAAQTQFARFLNSLKLGRAAATN